MMFKPCLLALDKESPLFWDFPGLLHGELSLALHCRVANGSEPSRTQVFLGLYFIFLNQFGCLYVMILRLKIPR